MKKISLFILAIMLTITSCKNYDDDFKDLNKSIAELQAQVAGFSSLQAGITALQSSVASLQATVNALPTTQVDLSGLEADLTAALANIASLQADLNTVIANYATSTDLSTAQASIDALTAALAAAQADLDELLAGNNVYDGDLNISNQAELDFAIGLGNKVMIINGSLEVYNDLDVAKVNLVTSKIVSIVDYAYIALDNGSVDLSALTSVGDYYQVDNTDAMDDALTSVGDWVYLDYDGGYDQPNLASAYGLSLSDYETDVDLSGDALGTLKVDFSGLTVTSPNSGTFSSATSVKFKNAYTNVTAPKALTVDMLAADYRNGLTVSAAKAGSVITVSGQMFGGSGPTYGNLAVTGSATSVLNVASTKAGNITVNGIATALSFPALTTAAAVSAPATLSFSAPLLVATSVAVAAAKTVSLASTPTLTAGVVETLTFSALTSPYTAVGTLKTATVTGKVGGAGAFTSTSATLASATFAGELDAVSLTGIGSTSDKLTSVTTTGAIDSFTLNDSDVITSISLGHSHIAGGAGSVLVITDNAKLASLTTSTDKLKTLTVKDNALLTTMNFASYTSVIATGAIAIDITNNKLSGTYTNAVAAGANPYVETVITSTSLVTLKPWVNAFIAATSGTSPASVATLAIKVDLENVGTVSVPKTLTAAQTADTAHLPLWSAGTYGVLDTVAEFLLIQ